MKQRDAPTGDSDRPYSVQPIPGKGLGLVATSKILRGTRIISEPPLLKFPALAVTDPSLAEEVAERVRALSNDEQLEFFALHNAHIKSLGPLCGIVASNGFSLGTEGTEAGLFLRATRINHACNPNTQNTWNPDIGHLTVHAVKDIEEGEEITITYVDPTANHATRQERLVSDFGFECLCEVCLLPEAQRQQRDLKMQTIARLDDMIGDESRMVSSPTACLHDARSLLRLLEEEDIGDARVARLYWDALQITIVNGDEARAKVFAQRMHDLRIVCEGEESPEANRIKPLIAEPSLHPLYGTSMRWERGPNDFPRGLGKQDFEEWLWKGA